MFGRKTNPGKALYEVQRIIHSGGTAKISYSQAVAMLSNVNDAQANLTREEYARFQEVYGFFLKQTISLKVDSRGYFEMTYKIIEEYERFFPFLLFSGEHSTNLGLQDELKIRKLYADGLEYYDALEKYEKDYCTIPVDLKYTPSEWPWAKDIFDVMQSWFLKVKSDCFLKALPVPAEGELHGTLEGFNLLRAEGVLLGAFEVFNVLYGAQILKEQTTLKEDTAITRLYSYYYGINGFPDPAIELIFKERCDTGSLLYTVCKGQNPESNPESNVDTVTNFVETRMILMDIEINISTFRKILDAYQRELFNAMKQHEFK